MGMIQVIGEARIRSAREGGWGEGIEDVIIALEASILEHSRLKYSDASLQCSLFHDVCLVDEISFTFLKFQICVGSVNCTQNDRSSTRRRGDG